MKKGLNNLKVIAALAILAALSIVLGKYLAIPVGDVMRFSLESMPIIFAGMAFGPAAGMAVGIVADMIGCVMVGYTVNPVVTAGAAAIGLMSGAVPLLLKKVKIHNILISIITVASAHLIGSVLIKTLGLAVYYDMPFFILMLWRILNYAVVGIIDGTAVHILINNKGIQMQLKSIGGERK
ncbi:MAG: folate family ECF transporter S component [Clostridia bacterium]|nr:folate family ECF transporter S component [Clostridia bacterium]